MEQLGRRLNISHLTSVELSKKVRGAGCYLKRLNGWDPELQTQTLWFDLSGCTEATVEGAGTLLCLLESAARAGIATKVSMPSVRLRTTELNALNKVASLSGFNLTSHFLTKLGDRYSAGLLLETVGFRSAARLLHLDNELQLCMVEEGEMLAAPLSSLPKQLRELSSYLDEDLARRSDEFSRGVLVPNALKFNWIERRSRQDLKVLAHELADVLVQADRGLSSSDAESITRTLLYEVIDNVRVHAFSEEWNGAALVGAVFVPSVPNASGSRYELQIFVGDSGIGITERLGPHYSPIRDDRYLSTSVRPWDPTSKTLVWALHPLSTSRDVGEDEPPIRGLSRILHQVEFLRGKLAIRSGQSMVTIDYAQQDPSLRYAKAALSQLPGTQVSASFPTSRRQHEIQTGNPTGVEALKRPRVCILRAGITTTQLDKALSEVLVDIEPGDPIAIVLPGLKVRPEEIVQVVERLARISALTSSHPTVCVFPQCPSGLLFSNLQPLVQSIGESGDTAAAHDLDAHPVTEAVLPDSPLLLIGDDWTATWYGRDPVTPNVVTLATREAGFVQGTANAAIQAAALAEPQAPSLSAPFSNWILRSSTLAISRLSLVDALASSLSGYILEHIRSNGRSVDTKSRLLPSLLTASRFVDLKTLLEDLGGSHLAGHVLGQVIRDQLTTTVSILVALPDAPEDYLDGLASAIGFTGRILRLDPDAESWRLIPAPGAGEGQAVLIGLMRHGGEPLRAVAEAMLRWGTSPQLAAVVLDGAEVPGEQIRALDLDVPVVAIAQDPVPPAPEPIEDLVAEIRRTEKPSYRYSLDDLEFCALLSSLGDGFALVHVERSEDRHLVGYYDFVPIVQDRVTMDSLIPRLVSAVLAECEPGCGKHVVAYPVDDPIRAGKLATELAGMLPGGSIEPIRRETGDLHPDAHKTLHSSHAVFLDWGVVTARTARQSLTHLMSSSARQCQFISVTSQLDIESEQHLTAIHTMRPPTGPRWSDRASGPTTEQLELKLLSGHDDNTVPTPPPVGEPIRVSFGSITRIPATTYSRATCPLCLAIGGLASYARNAPTKFIRDHAQHKVDHLRARPLKEALPCRTDLYDANLSPQERSAIIEMWTTLQRARTLVSARWGLIQELEPRKGHAVSLSKSIALCRILSARHDLLHVGPLNLSRFRRAVAGNALGVLTREHGQIETDPAVRQQAVVTLRATSKEAFVDNLVEIVGKNIESREVIGELLLGAFSILDRRYYPGPTLIDKLIRGLEDAEPLTSSAQSDVLWSIRTLRRQAQQLQSQASVNTPADAWRALKSEYAIEIRDHHHVINHFTRLRCRLDDLVITNALTYELETDLAQALARLSELWEPCVDFLSANVIPYLGPLAPQLTAEYYRDQVHEPDEWRRWVELVAVSQTRSLLVFDENLNRLRSGNAPLNVQSRDDLVNEIDFLAKFLVAIRPMETTEPARTNLLSTWLSECPSDLTHLRTAFEQELSNSSPAGKLNVGKDFISITREQVFCPEGLVKEAANLIVENAASRAKQAQCSLMLNLYATEAKGSITVIIESVGTVKSGAPRLTVGGGIRGLERRMGAFGVSITAAPIAADFRTSLTFSKA